MKLPISEMIITYLESLDKDEEVIEEEGQMAAPATDSSAAGGTLPVPPFGKVNKRKSLEDIEELI